MAEMIPTLAAAIVAVLGSVFGFILAYRAMDMAALKRENKDLHARLGDKHEK